MPQYLLRIEGVNIYATVEDTNQLSVQRGSSLLLRQAIKNIEEEFSQLRSISTGASIGLFLFKTENIKDVVDLRKQIAVFLNTDPNYQHLTFVVDVVAIKEDNNPANAEIFFKRAKEEVIALNRFRQFQQATLVFPPENKDPDIAPCAWDNLRPADGSKLSYISLSAGKRHNFGRTQKKEFIEQETGLSFDYTNDLQEIAETDEPHLNSLKDKLAVLYFDGNGFSDIQKNLSCTRLKRFDGKIQRKRKKWLRSLIETIQKDSDFKTRLKRKNGNKEMVEVDAIRLEILLWGGDEIMLAVPAWKGMEVLQHFYRCHREWTYPPDNKSSNKENKDKKHLTHAGGLVFCHVKTPIQRIKKLAREIADHIKDEYLGEPEEEKIDKYKPDANLYDYVVLESIDYPTQSWPAFLAKRYTPAIAKKRKPQRPLNDNHEVLRKALRNKFNELEKNLPRRQLYRLANALIESDQNFAEAYTRFIEVVDNADQVEKIVKTIFGDTGSNLHWLHLLELWDYFAPKSQKPTGNNTR